METLIIMIIMMVENLITKPVDHNDTMSVKLSEWIILSKTTDNLKFKVNTK